MLMAVKMNGAGSYAFYEPAHHFYYVSMVMEKAWWLEEAVCAVWRTS